jgi:hypothetical protein
MGPMGLIGLMCLRWAAANWKTASGPRASPKVENEDDDEYEDEQPQPTTANRRTPNAKRQTPNAKRYRFRMCGTCMFLKMHG